MADDKLAIRAILRSLWEKGLNARAAAKEINDVKGKGSVNERTAQNWFKRFKGGDTTLEEKPRTGRPSVVDSEALLEAIQQQPSSSTRALSAELGPSQSTINRHLRQLGLVNRRCQEVFGKPSKDPSNPDYVPSVFNTKPKATTSKKKKKQKVLASPEEGPTSETAENWNSVLTLQPIESEASTSGVCVPPNSQHDATDPTDSLPADSSTDTADSDVSKSAEKPQFKYYQRKIARSPSPTANTSVQNLTDPLKLCIVKMEIEDDGYNEDDSYLTTLTTTSPQLSQLDTSTASFNDPKTIKAERNREQEPIIFKVAPSIDRSSDSREKVETFFKNVAETVVQLPPHLIEETKVKISSLVYEMVIQAISEGCTNIQQPDL